MPIETKTMATLIDELCTTSQKLFSIQDKLPMMDHVEAGIMAKHMQYLNRRRNELMQAIDRKFGDGDSTPTGKTYK